MNKGVKLRLKIQNILLDIFKSEKKIDAVYINHKINKFDTRDISFINNVCMNTMRYIFHTKQILNLYRKKKSNIHEEILLCTAITQIVYLDFKDYAVIDSTIEVAKKFKIYHGFVNAILKKISKDKFDLVKIEINFEVLPSWFKKKASYLSNLNKKNIINTIVQEPDIHIVFKKKEYLYSFEEQIKKSTEVSGFLKEKVNLKKIKSYNEGKWWVQDFSSFFPLYNFDTNLLNKSNLDLCAAPGGKSFQVLSKNKNIILNDKNNERIKILISNLKRLKFKAKILNFDAINFKNIGQYDFIILDAPCSAVGTIRKNPEIFFRTKQPNFDKLIKTQKFLLDTASKLLKKNGIILYMVCSFLKSETDEQIYKFLEKNKNFSINKFFQMNKSIINNNFIKDNKMITLPSHINDFKIDGYFATYLRKDK